jgi:polar amino acid transport system substrate-binding protein
MTACAESNNTEDSPGTVIGYAYSDTNGRGKRAELRIPDNTQALLTRKGSRYTSLESLIGKKVGVQSNTIGKTFAERLNAANGNPLIVVIFENLALQGNAVKNCQIDAAVNAKWPLLDYAKNNPGTKVTAQFRF